MTGGARGRRGWVWLCVGLVVLECLATAADLLLGPYAAMHWEERLNARAGLLVACGHLGQTWNLQYQSFCGGCTAEALMAAGVFKVWQPTVLAFKLLPAGFHLGIVALGGALAWKLAGGRGAVVYLALSLGAPALFRKLGLTGWGNHAESSFFPLAAALLLVWTARVRSESLRLLLAGAAAGLGLWFCHTSAYALPALALLLLWRPRPLRSLLLFCCGAAAGFSPWIAYTLLHDGSTWLTLERTAGVGWGPGLTALLSYLGGDALLRALWLEHSSGDRAPLFAAIWWYTAWALALAGMGLALARSLRRGVDGSPLPYSALFGPLALVGLLAGYLFRFDLWLASVGSTDFFHLRYLSPLVPILGLCIAGGLAWIPGSRWRLALLLPAVALGLVGFGLRCQAWGPLQRPALGLTVVEFEESRGPAVFSSGVAGSLELLESRRELPSLCRQDHLFALGSDLCREGVVDPQARRALALTSSRSERRAMLDGCAGPLVSDLVSPGASCDHRVAEEILEQSSQALGLQAAEDRLGELAAALLRAAGPACDLGEAGLASEDLSPPLREGLCQVRGEQTLRQLGSRGSAGPGPGRRPQAGSCAGRQGWDYGTGWGRARWLGCDRDREAAAAGSGSAWMAGFEDGCQRFRSGLH